MNSVTVPVSASKPVCQIFLVEEKDPESAKCVARLYFQQSTSTVRRFGAHLFLRSDLRFDCYVVARSRGRVVRTYKGACKVLAAALESVGWEVSKVFVIERAEVAK